MNTLNDMKKFWQENKDKETAQYDTLNKEVMKKIIQPRIKKEQKTIKEYIFAFIFWQILVYSVLCNFIVRYWTDRQFILGCAIGILVFIIYTIIFQKNLKCPKYRTLNRQDAPLIEIYEDLKIQISYISRYFTYKKRLDIVGIPIISFVIMTVLLKAFPIPNTLSAGLITFSITLIVFIYGTYIENKKSFIKPLYKLRLILKDIENADE